MKLLCIFLLLAVSGFSQTLSINNTAYDTRLKVGDRATFTWVAPTDTTNLLYYRIRRGSTVSGPFSVWVTVPFDKVEYSFLVSGPYHYFVTAWYGVVENGVTTAQESVGSNQVRVRIAK